MEAGNQFIEYHPEEVSRLTHRLREEKVILEDLRRLYSHFDKQRKPENWTNEQFNTALTNLFFHWVKVNKESAVGASELLKVGLDSLSYKVEDIEIVGRLLSAYETMNPRWMQYFRTGKDIDVVTG